MKIVLGGKITRNFFSQDIYVKLLKITTKDIADYIIQNLTQVELLNFYRNYQKMITELKKNNKQISKEQFVDFLKTYNKTNPIKYTDNNKRRIRIPQPVREPEIPEEPQSEPEDEEGEGDGEGEEEKKENDLTSNKTTDLYNSKLPEVRNGQYLIRHKQNMKNISKYFDSIGYKEGEENTIPGKEFNQSHIFFDKRY